MKKDMTEGREWSSILLFSLPIMGANLLQVLYNLADSVIVGNLISATALGAVGLTSSMTWVRTRLPLPQWVCRSSSLPWVRVSSRVTSR